MGKEIKMEPTQKTDELVSDAEQVMPVIEEWPQYAYNQASKKEWYKIFKDRTVVMLLLSEETTAISKARIKEEQMYAFLNVLEFSTEEEFNKHYQTATNIIKKYCV